MKLRKCIEKLCYDKELYTVDIFELEFLTITEKIELTRLEMSFSSNVFLLRRDYNPKLFDFLKSLGDFKWKNLKNKLQYKYEGKLTKINHKQVLINLIDRLLNNPGDIEVYEAKYTLIYAFRLAWMTGIRSDDLEYIIKQTWMLDALRLSKRWSMSFIHFVLTRYYMGLDGLDTNSIKKYLFEDYDI